MREQILKLKEQGYSCKEIVTIVGCSPSTALYHFNPEVRSKALARVKGYRDKDENTRLKVKTRAFMYRQRQNVKGFLRGVLPEDRPFNFDDVVNKFGINTKCYLTGKPINLLTGDYHLDHIVPKCKGGLNTLDNLGITTRDANMAKNSLTVEEFEQLCIDVLTNMGYKVSK